MLRATALYSAPLCRDEVIVVVGSDWHVPDLGISLMARRLVPRQRHAQGPLGLQATSLVSEVRETRLGGCGLAVLVEVCGFALCFCFVGFVLGFENLKSLVRRLGCRLERWLVYRMDCGVVNWGLELFGRMVIDL